MVVPIHTTAPHNIRYGPEVEDDLALLSRWRAGDSAAGQALFSRYFAMIFRFFSTKCTPEAEELTQSTFLACVRARDQFRGDASFKTYLFTLARHELHHHLRTKARKLDRLDFELSSIAEIITSLGTKLARSQEHQQVVEALRRLPVEQQTLLELHYWEDLGIAELSEVFAISAQTLRARLYRARNALRQVLVSVAPAEALREDETMDAWMHSEKTSIRRHHIPE
jgi:RNA polymerase sigma factor (sigma-70 family)